MTLPSAPKSWIFDESAVSSVVGSVSLDRRVCTTENSSIPENGWIHSVWIALDGDPVGTYTLNVSTDKGQSRQFVFQMSKGAKGKR